MHVLHLHRGVTFEWDGLKAASNLRKHTISFELACEAFFDPFVLYLEDRRVAGEQRETIIGLTTNWQLLFVVYVLRNDIIRIISARLVSKAERKTYENQ